MIIQVVVILWCFESLSWRTTIKTVTALVCVVTQTACLRCAPWVATRLKNSSGKPSKPNMRIRLQMWFCCRSCRYSPLTHTQAHKDVLTLKLNYLMEILNWFNLIQCDSWWTVTQSWCLNYMKTSVYVSLCGCVFMSSSLCCSMPPTWNRSRTRQKTKKSTEMLLNTEQSCR